MTHISAMPPLMRLILFRLRSHPIFGHSSLKAFCFCSGANSSAAAIHSWPRQIGIKKTPWCLSRPSLYKISLVLYLIFKAALSVTDAPWVSLLTHFWTLPVASCPIRPTGFAEVIGDKMSVSAAAPDQRTGEAAGTKLSTIVLAVGLNPVGSSPETGFSEMCDILPRHLAPQSGHISFILALSFFARIRGCSTSVASRSRGRIISTTRCWASRFA
jgi:hypothetical protein